MRREDAQVAILALTYQALWRQRVSCELALFDFAEEEPGEISWCVLFALDLLTDADWDVMWRLVEDEEDFVSVARSLRFSDPLRAEALLHAPVESRCPRGRWPEQLTRRWEEVRDAVGRVKGEGFVSSHDEVELVASDAWQQVTGKDSEAFEDECESFVAYAELTNG